MLRNLVGEIVRRRLWPIPAVALLVVLAVPLLFLKPAPQDAPPAAAVAPAPAGEAAGDLLPARAQRLLATSDAYGKASGRLSRGERDPFQPPASRGAAASSAAAAAPASAKTAAASSSAGSKQTDPIAVVIKNPDGSTPAAPASPAASSGGGGQTSTARSSEASSLPSVDVRFGARRDSHIRRRIGRLKTFRAGGKVVAVFVKYSPGRDRAVFAIARSTIVTGDVECRRKEGLCRFVDIPAGKHVRLRTLTDAGTPVSRRLDVVRVHRNG